MATPGTLLFKRGQGSSDNELWDDTALIKAYDNAIKSVKEKIKIENGEDPSGNITTPTKPKNKNKRKRNKAKKRKWAVGNRCRAIFSEDGLCYEAEIVRIDHNSGTCVVQYDGYGNEEEKTLEDLLPMSHKPSKLKDSDIDTDKDSMDWCGMSARSESGSHMSSSNRKSRKSANRQGFPSFSNLPHPGSMPAFAYPAMPPPPSFAGFPGCPPSPVFPPFIPPPPPQMLNESIADDQEALCSMLMSWYISGYHTGYYQALKQAKQPKGYHVPTSKHSDR